MCSTSSNYEHDVFGHFSDDVLLDLGVKACDFMGITHDSQELAGSDSSAFISRKKRDFFRKKHCHPDQGAASDSTASCVNDHYTTLQEIVEKRFLGPRLLSLLQKRFSRHQNRRSCSPSPPSPPSPPPPSPTPEQPSHQSDGFRILRKGYFYYCPLCNYHSTRRYNTKIHLKKVHDLDPAPEDQTKISNVKKIQKDHKWRCNRGTYYMNDVIARKLRYKKPREMMQTNFKGEPYFSDDDKET